MALATPSSSLPTLSLPSSRLQWPNTRSATTRVNFGRHNPSLEASRMARSKRISRRGSLSSSSIGKREKEAEHVKRELLEAIAPLDRGADAGEDDRERIDQIARRLEALNPTKKPLESDLLDGKWELIYTTSRSLLATERPKLLRPNGKIFQSINVDTLRAQNMETWPYFTWATANLVPLSEKKVAVQFDTFKILGLISIKAPTRVKGELEITYVDEELRVSRGDRGNLFILKMVDKSHRIPA